MPGQGVLECDDHAQDARYLCQKRRSLSRGAKRRSGRAEVGGSKTILVRVTPNPWFEGLTPFEPFRKSSVRRAKDSRCIVTGTSAPSATARTSATICDENAGSLPPPPTREQRMSKRRRFKQTLSLEKRLAEEAKRMREQAELLPHGPRRDQIVRKARQCETGSDNEPLATIPGLKSPE